MPLLYLDAALIHDVEEFSPDLSCSTMMSSGCCRALGFSLETSFGVLPTHRVIRRPPTHPPTHPSTRPSTHPSTHPSTCPLAWYSDTLILPCLQQAPAVRPVFGAFSSIMASVTACCLLRQQHSSRGACDHNVMPFTYVRLPQQKHVFA